MRGISITFAVLALVLSTTKARADDDAPYGFGLYPSLAYGPAWGNLGRGQEMSGSGRAWEPALHVTVAFPGDRFALGLVGSYASIGIAHEAEPSTHMGVWSLYPEAQLGLGNLILAGHIGYASVGVDESMASANAIRFGARASLVLLRFAQMDASLDVTASHLRGGALTYEDGTREPNGVSATTLMFGISIAFLPNFLTSDGAFDAD